MEVAHREPEEDEGEDTEEHSPFSYVGLLAGAIADVDAPAIIREEDVFLTF